MSQHVPGHADPDVVDPSGGEPGDGDEWQLPPDETTSVPPSVDLSKPSVARLYDHALGGKTNFVVDRELYKRVAAVFPDYRPWALANREFLVRAVTHMAEQGVRQFIDLGSGIPTSPNVHEVARKTHEDAVVVYVDSDPVAVTHALALLGGPGVVAVRRDVREPDDVLRDPQVRATIDFDRPVGLLLIAVLHMVRQDVAVNALNRYVRELAPGSMVAVSAYQETQANRFRSLLENRRDTPDVELHAKTVSDLEALFEGLEVVGPGVVDMRAWRPDATAVSVDAAAASGLAGLGRVG